MALKAVAKKEPEKEAPEEKRRPLYRVRARQQPGSDFFIDVGAAWEVEWSDKKTGEVVKGLSLKLTNIPVNWDGSALMLPPREE